MANQILLNFIDANFNLVNTEIIPLIEKDYLKVGVSEITERAKLTLVALVNETLSKEELANIWNTLPSDPEIVAALKQVIIDLVNKIEEPEVKEGLLLLVEPIVNSIVILTDNEGSNKELLGQLWKEFLNSPELLVYALQHLEWIIKKFIKDDNAVKWIMKLINAFTSK